MRRDYLIAILLGVAAIPLGAALMVATDYLHLSGYLVPLTFWGGIALAVALITVAILIALRGERSESRAVSRRSHEPRNVPLHEAIWRVHLGRWGERETYGNDWTSRGPFHKTCAEVRQKALDGKLPVWGNKGPNTPFEPIPMGFWATHDIEANYNILPKVTETWVYVTEPTKIGQTTFARTLDWSNFMTSREVVEELWPPPKGREPVS